MKTTKIISQKKAVIKAHQCFLTRENNSPKWVIDLLRTGEPLVELQTKTVDGIFKIASHSAMTAIDFLCTILVKGNRNDVAQFSIRKLVGPLEHLSSYESQEGSLVETLGQEDT